MRELWLLKTVKGKIMTPAEILKQFDQFAQMQRGGVFSVWHIISPVSSEPKAYLRRLMLDNATRGVNVLQDSTLFFNLVTTFKSTLLTSIESADYCTALLVLNGILNASRSLKNLASITRDNTKILGGLMQKNTWTQENFIDILKAERPEDMIKNLINAGISNSKVTFENARLF